MCDVHTGGHIRVCMYTRKPEAYTKVLPGFLSTSLTEAGSLELAGFTALQSATP